MLVRNRMLKFLFAGLAVVALCAATVMFTGCPEEPQPWEPEEPVEPIEPDLPEPEEDEPNDMPDPEE